MTEHGIGPDDLNMHVLRRSVVHEGARLLYVPTPKAACTSILWGIADLAGLDDSTFHGSMSFEPLPALTIHDMDRWPDENRLWRRSEEDQLRILNEEGWFRFTVVRDPLRRMWSAWQSKILTAEPSMARLYEGRAWFPSAPSDPDDVVESFRTFVRAMGAATIDGDWPTLDGVSDNPHWLPQTVLLGEGGLRLFRVGKLEEFGDTLDALHKHLADIGIADFRLQSANESRLGYQPALYDREGLAVAARLYRADLEVFGYDLPGEPELDEDLSEWKSRTAPALPTIEAMTQHNARLRVLYDAGHAMGRQLERAAGRVASARSARDRSVAELERVRRRLQDANGGLAEHKAWLKSTNERLDENKRWLKQANRRLERSERNVADLERQIADLERQIADLGRQLERADLQRIAAEDRYTAARANARFVAARSEQAALRAADTDREIEAMRRSWSWRVTAPVRRWSRWFGRSSATSEHGEG